MDRNALVNESTAMMAAGFDAMKRSDWRESARRFSAAAKLREQLEWRNDDEDAWLLSAAWLNLGDVLVRTGDAAILDEAMRAFDRTLEVMSGLDPCGNPAFVDRLVLTWLNRGTARCGMLQAERSLADFESAAILLRQWGEDITPTRRFLSAMLRINRGRSLLLASRPLEAWQEAGAGVSRLRAMSGVHEAAVAEIQACSLGCRALSMLLDEPDGPAKVGDWIAEATDSAERALVLVKATGFRDHWVTDLIRYGAIIYRACQPHFLGEFLAEWLGDGGPLSEEAALKEEMRNFLWITIGDAERNVLEAPHQTEFVGRQTRVVKALQKGLAAIR